MALLQCVPSCEHRAWGACGMCLLTLGSDSGKQIFTWSSDRTGILKYLNYAKKMYF